MRPGADLKILAAVLDPGLDVCAHLTGRLYLQAIPDTRRILQDASAPPPDMAHVAAADCPRLVPLVVEGAEDAVSSKWPWGRCGAEPTIYPYARWVTVRLPAPMPSSLNPDRLYNLIHDYPDRGWYNINFHSVYLHDRDWQRFRLLHITDSHVAWRNDTISSVLEPRFMGVRDRLVNFNQNLREFICYANARHRSEHLDLIVLTGDIVDFVNENFSERYGRDREKDLGPETHYPRPIDNFELFRDLVIAWASHPGIVTGEELEVPLLTVTGNHDYRLNEYPLIHTLHIEVGGIDISALHKDPIGEYETFALNEQEACAYEGGLPHIDNSVAASFVEYSETPPTTYRSLINPDGDWALELGPHRMVGLDTGHDYGVVDSIVEYLFRKGSQKMFVEGSPNSAGFSAEQIGFLQEQVRMTEGLLLVACHAPLVNMRYTPHHFLRESEHKNPLSADERDELVAFLLSNRPEATEIEKYWPLVGGGSNFLLTGDPFSSGVLVGLLSFMKWFGKATQKSPAERLRDEGWPLGGSKPMRVGDRNACLEWGVAANRFKAFVDAVESRVSAGKTATLVLAGHKHQSIEYVITSREGENGGVHFYHDYYLDNTIHGRRPQDYWCSESIPDAEGFVDPGSLRHWKSPLHLQTMSLGPKPSGQQPNHRLGTPFGAARVKSGRFALYDLPDGTYAVHFVSDDERQSGVGAFDFCKVERACGDVAITLRLDLRNGRMPPLTAIDYSPSDFRSRDLGTGDLLVVAGTLKPVGVQPLPSGWVYVTKAPPPAGGALEIEVVDGEICGMRRVSLVEMRLEAAEPRPADVMVYSALQVSMP
jgi:hypothetical protein